MHAETAYLFRHALLRDAAYQLQLPSERSRLHGLALEVIEALHGGRAPEPQPLEPANPPEFIPHPSDVFALELAQHARLSEGEASSSTALHQRYLRRAAEFNQNAFQLHVAVECWGKLAAILKGVSKGIALNRRARLLLELGQSSSSELVFSESLEIARTTGSEQLESVVLCNLTNLYRLTGRADMAERAGQSALVISRRIGAQRIEGAVLTNLAAVYQDTARIEECERTAGLAQGIWREVGDRKSEGTAIGILAIAHQISGRHEMAERLFEQALGLFRASRDRRSEGVYLGNLAALYRETGRHAQAERSQLEALGIHREVGSRRFEGISIGLLANVYLSTGRLEEAERLLTEAAGICRECEDRRQLSLTRFNIASLYRMTHRPELALELFHDVAENMRVLGDRRLQGLALCESVPCLLQVGQTAKAEAIWRQGASLLRELNLRSELERRLNVVREACAKAGVAPFE